MNVELLELAVAPAYFAVPNAPRPDVINDPDSSGTNGVQVKLSLALGQSGDQ